MAGVSAALVVSTVVPTVGVVAADTVITSESLKAMGVTGAREVAVPYYNEIIAHKLSGTVASQALLQAIIDFENGLNGYTQTSTVFDLTNMGTALNQLATLDSNIHAELNHFYQVALAIDAFSKNQTTSIDYIAALAHIYGLSKSEVTGLFKEDKIIEGSFSPASTLLKINQIYGTYFQTIISAYHLIIEAEKTATAEDDEVAKKFVENNVKNASVKATFKARLNKLKGAPFVINDKIADHSLVEGKSASVDLNGHFYSQRPGNLTNIINVMDTSVAKVYMRSGKMVIEALKAGVTTVNVYALDDYGQSETLTFKVMVEASPLVTVPEEIVVEPTPINPTTPGATTTTKPEVNSNDLSTYQGPTITKAIPSASVVKTKDLTVKLSDYIDTKRPSNISYTATSSDTNIAKVAIKNGVLFVTGVTVGKIQVTIAARDDYGQSPNMTFSVQVINATDVVTDGDFTDDSTNSGNGNDGLAGTNINANVKLEWTARQAVNTYNLGLTVEGTKMSEFGDRLKFTVDANNASLALGAKIVTIATKTPQINNKKKVYVLYKNRDGSLDAVPHQYSTDGNQLEILTTKSGDYVLSTNVITFKDVQSHYSRDFVTELASRHIIKGSDAKYMPNKSLTRAQFMLMIARSLELDEPGKSKFYDIQGQEVEGAYNALEARGLLRGLKGLDGAKFSPNATLTREEAVLVMMDVLSFTGTATGINQLPTFVDAATISGDALMALGTLQRLGIVSGKPIGNGTYYFDGKGTLTRAQMSKILYNTLTLSNFM